MAQSVQFFQPGTEGAIDYGQIQRQRALAEMLQKQGMTPQQGQMVSGHYVAPSPLSYVAQLASVLAGKYKENQADEREQTLLRNVQAQRSKEAQDFMSASSGTPAVPGRSIAPLTPNDDEGNAMPSADVAGQAAVAPDRNRALAIALQSQNPALQGMGGKMMERQMDAEELKSVLATAGIGQPAAGGVSVGGGEPGPAPAGAPRGAAAPSGGIPGIDPRAMALTLSRLPQAQKLGGMIQEASKPTVLAEGGTALERGPNGGWVPGYIAPKTEPGIGVVSDGAGGFNARPVGGYGAAKADIAGQVAGAEAKAKDPYTGLVRIGDRWLTPAQARAEAGAGAPPAPAAPRPRAPQGGGIEARGAFTGSPEQVLATIDAAPVSAAVKAEMRSSYARQQGGTNPAYNDMGTGAPASGPAAPAGPGIAVPSEASAEYDKTRAKDFAAQAADYQKGARSASGTLRTLGQLEQLYSDPNIAKGGAAESISSLKNLATSAGVDVKGLGAEQAIQAITNKMALESRSTAEGGGMPGAMSDSDREFLKAMQPGLSKTPEGRAQIIAASRAVAQRQVEVARMANAYEQQHGRLDAGFDRQVADYAAKTPMFAGQKPAAAGGGFKILKVR